MSRILVLGGTRFVGRLTAMNLAGRHDVTVLSRRPGDVPGTRRVVAERAQGLKSLKGSRFDIVLDFIAYDQEGVAEACTMGEAYFAVSSTWLARLNSAAADAMVPEDDSAAPANMLPATRRYLLGKARLERAVFERFNAGQAATVVRLPILMGDDDHTARLEFYRSRIADGRGLLLVNGGVNAAQLLWSHDAVRLLVALVESGHSPARVIWEALPDSGHRVADFVTTVANAMDRSVRLVPASAAMLARKLGTYLDHEPLWREQALEKTEANLFTRFGLEATAPVEWLTRLSRASLVEDASRPAELAMIEKLS